MLVSNVCRAKLPKSFLDSITEAGMHSIPADVLAPRELAINNETPFTSVFKLHRGQTVQTVTRTEAERLVALCLASYEAQSLLVYTKEDYLSDSDVQADKDEWNRANDSEETLVAVAVIGGARGPVTVLRNIVSGQCSGDRVKKDAEKALKKSNYVLIE